MNNQKGFTLIELVVVIVILGILSAFALPKFVDLQTDARKSTLDGLAGSIRSASSMVHAKALATNASGSVNIGDGSVELSGKYPAANGAGIEAAIQDLSGFETNSSGVFWPTGVTDSSNCKVTYTAGTPPTVSVDNSGCN